MIGALFTLLLALAQQAETLRAAEAAYRAGRFAEAKLRCEVALADPSIAAGPVLFNLGNCAYRLGRPAEALWHYRNARLHLPRDAALHANLALAERQLGLRADLPDSIGSSIAGAVAGLTRRERLWLASLAHAVGLLGLVALRRRGLRLASLALALSGLTGLLLVTRAAFWPGPPPGLVLDGGATLRADPLPDAPRLAELRAGTPVRIDERSDRWVRIAHPGGSGWTELSAVGAIE